MGTALQAVQNTKKDKTGHKLRAKAVKAGRLTKVICSIFLEQVSQSISNFDHALRRNRYLKPQSSQRHSHRHLDKYKSNESTLYNLNSFILNIYIAPLQENYSQALPTPARSNKAVLR